MPLAARIGDLSNEAGVLLPPVPAPPALATVLIEGKPAAVIGCIHECVPHYELGPANRVLPAPGPPRTVLVAGLPLACVGDPTVCQAKIATGSLTVQTGGPL